MTTIRTGVLSDVTAQQLAGQAAGRVPSTLAGHPDLHVSVITGPAAHITEQVYDTGRACRADPAGREVCQLRGQPGHIGWQLMPRDHAARCR